MAAAAFLSASVGAEVGRLDIASSAFLSAAAETAGGGSTFSLPAVPEFCADGDCIKANTITEAVARESNFCRNSLIVSSSQDYFEAGQSVLLYPGTNPK